MKTKSPVKRLISTSSATVGGVVTSYLDGIRVGHIRNGSPPRRKRAYPGFKIRMMSFRVDQILARAECMGTTVRDFVSSALLDELDACAREIGMSPRDIAKLSKRERRKICHKYCLVVNALSGSKSEQREAA